MNKPATIVHDIQTPAQFGFIRAGDLKPRPMNWQINTLFESDSLVLIVGPPSVGKSFWTMDLAACIATGTDHHGRTAKQGGIHYIAGEGHNGIARRLKAWQIKNATNLDDAPFFVSQMPATIGDPVNTSAVMEAIKETGAEPALVVLDTLNRNMAGNENDTADMRAFIQCCDEIRAAHKCTVALVHHTGHGDQSRARGSSVLHGAIDTTFMLSKSPAGIVTVECTRMKDGPIPDPFAFKFRTVEIGIQNDDGTEATSAVLHPTDIPEEQPKVTGKNQTAALAALDDLFEQRQANLEGSGHEPTTARVRMDDWRDACMKRMGKTGFYAAKKSLVDKGQIEIEPGGFVRRNQ